MPTQTNMSIQRLEEKLKLKPNSLVFSRLADFYRKGGDVQQAIAICVQGLESHPNYVTGRIILGRCYLEQENFNDAIKEFTRVCQLDKRNQIAIKMLADIFSKQGMEEKAGDLYNLLLRMDIENPSLEHLTTVFKGTNKSNLYEILGIDETVPQPAPAATEVQGAEPEQAGLEALDVVEDVEMPMEEGEIASPAEVMPEMAEVQDGGDVDVGMDFADLSAVEEEPEPAAGQSLEDSMTPESIDQVVSPEESIAEDTAAPDIMDLPESVEAPAAEEVGMQEIDLASTLEEPVSQEAIEPSLDEVLTTEPDEGTSEPIAEDVQKEPEAAVIEEIGDAAQQDIVSGEKLMDMEGLDELELPAEAEITEEIGDITQEQSVQAPAAEKEVTPGQEEDISVRMDAMFGDEAETVEAQAAPVDVLSSETEKDELAAVLDAKDSTRPTEIVEESEKGGTGEMSSRMEDMFGEAEELTVPVAAEDLGLEPSEEPFLTGELGTASTQIIDRERLEGESELEGLLLDEEPVVEEAEDGVSAELQSAEIVKEESLSIDELPEIEEEVATKPTEIFERQPKKAEDVLAETHDMSDMAHAPVQEPVEEPSDEGKEETPEDIVTDATAVYDREMIKRLAASEPEPIEETADTYEETVDTYEAEIPSPQASLSGQEVISRLDEMFPTEGKPEPVHVTDAQTREFKLDIEAEEEIDTLGAESLSQPAEPLAASDEAEIPGERFPETAFIETVKSDRGRIDKVPASPEKEEEARDFEGTMERQQTKSFELDSIEKSEPLSGDEVASRIDEMFAGGDELEEESIASIPDEDVDESKLVGEFYTESGDAAFLEEESESLDLPIPETGDAIGASEFSLDGDLNLFDEESVPEDDSIAVELQDDGFGEESAELTVDEEMPFTLEQAEEGVEAEEGIPSVEESLSDVSMGEEPGVEEEMEQDILAQASLADEEAAVNELEVISIPDNEIEEEEQTGEFYTETGDVAPTEDSGIAQETGEEYQMGESSVEASPAGEELVGAEEETMVADVSLTSIPDDDFDESEPISEFYTESGAGAEPCDTVSTEESMIVLDSDEVSRPEVFMEDVVEDDSGEVVDTVVSDDRILEESIEEAVLDSVNEDEFYTISADNTPVSRTDDRSMSVYEEEEEQDEDIVAREERTPVKSDSVYKEKGREALREQKEDIAEKADSIPDHVLTPTLADIYFQQDQPYLAVQIYKRLLERDPDNERIVQRIAEIERIIKEREAEIEHVAQPARRQKKKAGRKKKTSRTKSRDDGRPLKGIRIKKRVKERIKKKKQK